MRKLRPAPPDPIGYRLRRILLWSLEKQVPAILFMAWLVWLLLT